MGNSYSGCPSMCTPSAVNSPNIQRKRVKKPKRITSSMITQDLENIGSLCEHCRNILKKKHLNKAKHPRDYDNEVRQFLTLESEKTNFCTCERIGNPIDEKNFKKSIHKKSKKEKRPKQLSDFQVIRGLGRGAYGKVYMIKKKPSFNQINQDAQYQKGSFQYTMNSKVGIPDKLSEYVLIDNNFEITTDKGSQMIKSQINLQSMELVKSQQKSQIPQQNTSQINAIIPQIKPLVSFAKCYEDENLATYIPIKQNNLNKVEDSSGLNLSQSSEGSRTKKPRTKEQTYFAMKIIPKERIHSEEDKSHLLSQRYILEAVNNRFIVKLHYAFQTPKKLYLIVDLMPGGELFYLLRSKKKFQQSIAKFYAAEILLALEYLHQRNIIYRDLKPQNILLNADGHVKLTDFGLSKVCYHDQQKVYSLCGTPEYIAPEVIMGNGYSKAADLFSFASLLYDMLTGKPPFYCSNKNTMMKNLISKPVPLPSYLSDNAKSLFHQLFAINPQDRLGYECISDIKSHPFFSDIDFQALERGEIEAPIKFKNNLKLSKRQADKQTKENLYKSNLRTTSSDDKKSSQHNQSSFHDQNGDLYVNDSGFENWNSCDIVKVDNSMMKDDLNENSFSQNKLEGFSYNRPSYYMEDGSGGDAIVV